MNVSRRRTLWGVLSGNRLALTGLLGLGLVVLAAMLAPWLTPYGVRETFAPLLPPSRAHPLGTNDLGYDLWTELLAGARFSLLLSSTAAGVAVLVGVVLGSVAGYYRGVGVVLLRLVDVLLAVPRFAVIVLLAAFTRPGFGNLLLFFAVFGWPSVARIVASRIRTEAQLDYVVALEALGVPRGRILFRHLVPATLPVAYARLVAEMRHVILAEAGLSYLGLADPTTRSWGMTLWQASRYPALFLGDVWQWWALPAGLAITVVCLALVFIGLALEPLANPRLG